MFNRIIAVTKALSIFNVTRVHIMETEVISSMNVGNGPEKDPSSSYYEGLHNYFSDAEENLGNRDSFLICSKNILPRNIPLKYC